MATSDGAGPGGRHLRHDQPGAISKGEGVERATSHDRGVEFPRTDKPAIIVKRVPGVTFPYRYMLTAEHITLVGSIIGGKVYVTARIDPTGMVGAAKPGTLEGSYPHNPVVIGTTNVDILITATVAGAIAPRAPSSGSKVPRIGP